jgi:hypothetical protein
LQIHHSPLPQPYVGSADRSNSAAMGFVREHHMPVRAGLTSAAGMAGLPLA